jgi:hypothetical protein
MAWRQISELRSVGQRRWSPRGVVSAALNLGPGDGHHQTDVYVRNLDTGVVTLLSHTRCGKSGNGASYQPALWLRPSLGS